jgi:hypothetical protein
MVDKERDPGSKRDFADALASTMHANGAGRKKGYLVAGAAVVAIAAGVAVAVGATGSSKTPMTVSGGDLSGLRHTAASGQATSFATPPPHARPSASSAAADPAAKHVPASTANKSGFDVVVSPAPGGSVPQKQQGAGGGASPSSSGAPSASLPLSSSTLPKNASSPSAAPTQTAAVAASFHITGQIACTSGKPVVGVWVSAVAGSAFAPWRGLGNGATADWWYDLPKSEDYSLHVGCGGSPSSWAVATYTTTVSGGHNSFDCHDTGSDLGQCIRR